VSVHWKRKQPWCGHNRVAFLEAVFKQKMYKFLKFTADWCGPCKTIAGDIASLSETYNIEVETVDIDRETGMEMSNHFDVKSIPTIIVVHNSDPLTELESVKGANKEQIELLFSKYMQKQKKANIIASAPPPFSADALYRMD
jgi:thioredoxin-like negative regulator of GroEL